MLKARVIQELRRGGGPLTTGELARRCGWRLAHPTSSTLTVLLVLEACGVVRRLSKVKCAGRGRPAWRWVLTTGGA
jgi:DNA-binding IclR family transcriptional regulator